MRQNMRLRMVGILALLGGAALAEARPARGAGGLPANADTASSEKPRRETDASEDGSQSDPRPQFFGAGREFEILPAHTAGQCLDVEAASLSAGVPLQQYNCHGGPNQGFLLTYLGAGEYAVRAVHSGQCLDVAGASRANGAPLLQWPCHGGSNQRYRINADPSGAYEIQAVHSNKCLDVEGASTTAHARLIQWPCTGGLNQRFYLQPR